MHSQIREVIEFADIKTKNIVSRPEQTFLIAC